jgi:RimJ/RimL family protein N-acetyltransferase
LTPWGQAHLDLAHRIWSDPDVRRYLWDDKVVSREVAGEVLRQSERDFAIRGFGLWGIHLRDDGPVIGFVGLRMAGYAKEPELLYGLLPAWWHRGFATESGNALLAHAFVTLRLDRIAGATDVPNTASVRVMERLGMRFLRRGAMHGLDTFFYGIGREEWQTTAEARQPDKSPSS